ncbi:hypothetical protein DFH29DRAFT_994871 [Suillus ampliporus]|nr:hypothetical protein DFH29DRAFT_994871 [Suillus ampliporus]
MQVSTLRENDHYYLYVHKGNKVVRFAPFRAEEPFGGLVSSFSFIGYLTFDYQFSPIFWPDEHPVVIPSTNIRCVGSLSVLDDTARFSIFAKKNCNTVFLEDIEADTCGSVSDGTSCDIWFLHQLPNFVFKPSEFPLTFLHPAPPTGIPVRIPPWHNPLLFLQEVMPRSLFQQALPRQEPSQLSFQDALPQSLFQDAEASSHPSLLTVPLDYDSMTTANLTTVSPSDVLFGYHWEDVSPLHSANPDDPSTNEAPVLHADLRTRTPREDILTSVQKQSLKQLLTTSPWGPPIKLGKYIFLVASLVGTVNPFDYDAYMRRLVTTSFMKALNFYGIAYETLLDEPLVIDTNVIVTWEYYRNNFLTYFKEYASDIRKVVRGGTTPATEFTVDPEERSAKMLQIINLLASGKRLLIQEAITIIVLTQGFKGSAIFRVIPTLRRLSRRQCKRQGEIGGCISASRQNHLSSKLLLFPSLVIEMTKAMSLYKTYQAILPDGDPNHKHPKLEIPDLYHQIITALDDMYAHPNRFINFFQVVGKLPYLQEENILVLNSKNQVPKKLMQDLDPINDVVAHPPLEVPNAQYRFPDSFHDVFVDEAYFRPL